MFNKYNKKTDGRRNKSAVNKANINYFDYLEDLVYTHYNGLKCPILTNRKQDILVKIDDSNSFTLDTKTKILNNKKLTNEDIQKYALEDLKVIISAFSATQDSKNIKEILYENSEALGDLIYKKLRVAPIDVKIADDNSILVEIKDYMDSFGTVNDLDLTQINVDLKPVADFIVQCYLEDTKDNYEGMLTNHNRATLTDLDCAIKKELQNRGFTDVSDLEEHKKIVDANIVLEWRISANKDGDTEQITFTDSAIYDAVESQNSAQNIDYYAKELINNFY
ncbi:hypothetical protein [Enterococcus casseliflavus]|uniref:hypothetical protein n=1 Tax=Enterococcus casseliflavus TaxID=37734 RepID=UPI002542B997|nr:hypothetical protein [Enterococcus casseliflavus]MDK4448969.1 hypothetical protein [Enterococcus casseliflavus]